MITLDGKRLEEFGYRALLEHYHEAVPKIRRKTIAIPGMPGRWDFGSELESKALEIPIRSLSDSSSNLQRLQNELVAFLMDDFGRPRLLKMVFDYEPDKFYTVKVDDAIAPTLRAHIARNMTLPFIAHDPYKYSNVTSEEIVWGSNIITFEYNYKLGHDGFSEYINIKEDTDCVVTVDGLAVRPIIKISGSAKDLKVESNGYEIKFDNFNDADFIIDIENFNVIKNGKESLKGVEFRDFLLFPGNNKINITGKVLEINLFIKHRDKFS